MLRSLKCKSSKIKKVLITFLILVTIGLMIPQQLQMPVDGATPSDFHPESFWYYPWGKSVTHKGIDIFAKKGTAIHAATSGIVLYAGNRALGGKTALVLGPKWRLHYYAHLNELNTTRFSLVSNKTLIGRVGTSGNATGKPPHLHYSIFTLVPYPWRIDGSKQGWMKMFFLDPIYYLGNK